MEEGEEFHQGFLVPEHHSTGSWEIRTLLMMCERTIHTLELSFFFFLFFFKYIWINYTLILVLAHELWRRSKNDLICPSFHILCCGYLHNSCALLQKKGLCNAKIFTNSCRFLLSRGITIQDDLMDIFPKVLSLSVYFRMCFIATLIWACTCYAQHFQVCDVNQTEPSLRGVFSVLQQK